VIAIIGGFSVLGDRRSDKASEKGKGGFYEKILFLVVVPVMMAVLIQCVSAPQRWPAYERRTEDRMFALQQRIGNGLASGELTPTRLRISGET